MLPKPKLDIIELPHTFLGSQKCFNQSKHHRLHSVCTYSKQSNLLTKLLFKHFHQLSNVVLWFKGHFKATAAVFLTSPRLKLALPSLHDMTVWLIRYYHQATFNSNLLLNPAPIPWGAEAWSFYSITVIVPLLNNTVHPEINKSPVKWIVSKIFQLAGCWTKMCVCF